MPTWNRSKALLTMTSALPADTLIPVSLSAHEALSTPFQFNVEVVCQQDNIDPDKLLHQPACVTLQADGAPIRYFHGIVQTVVAGSPIRGLAGGATHRVFHLTLVPRLWFMSQTLDCRVYENKSAADILKAIFADVGLTDLSGPPSATAREYTVQFNESDLHFATRLMEEEGWFYFFQHTASAHTLVVAKDNAAFKAIPKATLSAGGANSAAHTPVEDFHKSTATVFGQWMLKDYDPDSPTTQLKSDVPTTLATPGARTRDAFRWPAVTPVGRCRQRKQRHRCSKARHISADWCPAERSRFPAARRVRTMAPTPCAAPATMPATRPGSIRAVHRLIRAISPLS